jgi:hypothetical protein
VFSAVFISVNKFALLTAIGFLGLWNYEAFSLSELAHRRVEFHIGVVFDLIEFDAPTVGSEQTPTFYSVEPQDLSDCVGNFLVAQHVQALAVCLEFALVLEALLFGLRVCFAFKDNASASIVSDGDHLPSRAEGHR